MPHPHTSFVTYQPGDVVTDGLERLLLTGSEPAVVDRIEVDDADEHLEVLGTMLAGPDRKVGSIQFSEGFPPENPAFGPLTPAEGATITPDEVGYELLIGLRVVKPGFAIRRGIRVHYSVGGRQHVVAFPADIVLCGPLDEDACEDRWREETD